MKKILIISVAALLACTAQAAFAHSGDEIGCSTLHIQIANDTPTSCRLIDRKVIHGNMETSPPEAILSGDSSRFDMVETLKGPEVDLTYRCNGKTITFKTQQNYCSIFTLGAGSIHTEVLSHDSGIHAKANSDMGSYIWSRPGQVSWTLSS